MREQKVLRLRVSAGFAPDFPHVVEIFENIQLLVVSIATNWLQ
ncbi:MAG: hypothetical protein RIS22_204 [Actinomycetota bacterium]|jgi:hypothetical protein